MATTYAQSHTRTFEDALLYKRAALVALGLIGLCIVLYAYALGSTVHFIMARSASQKEAQALSAHIGKLQVAYLAKAQAVNLDTGATLGLHEAKTISFVNRGTTAMSRVSVATGHEF